MRRAVTVELAGGFGYYEAPQGRPKAASRAAGPTDTAD